MGRVFIREPEPGEMYEYAASVSSKFRMQELLWQVARVGGADGIELREDNQGYLLIFYMEPRIKAALDVVIGNNITLRNSVKWV